MRRLVVLLVIALVGAGLAGRFVGASAVQVNATTLSNSTMRAELDTLHAHPSYACYLNALIKINTKSTATRFNAAGVATWTKIQVEGLNVVDYVEKTYHWSPTAKELATARVGYANDLTAAAGSAGVTCASSASTALAELPSWFLTNQLTQNAASEEYVAHLPHAVPVTDAGLHAFYNAHPTYYQTICISVAYVPAAKGQAFARSQAAGMSVSDLAKTYSVDPTAKSGGVYGCYGPTSSSYTIVREYTTGTPLNTFPTTPRIDQTSSGTFLLYVAPTKRTNNPFDKVASQVLIDVQNYNAALASLSQGALLASSAVSVDPAYALWNPTKGSVSALVTPPKKVTPNAGAGLGI